MSKRTAHFIEHIAELDRIAETVNKDDPSTLWGAIDKYLQYCAVSGLLISNTSFYRALGISKETMHAWSHGTRKAHNPEYKEFALFVKRFCAAAREQYGIEGIVSPLMTIWLQKHYDGFTDNPPQEIERNPLGEIKDPGKIARKYGFD